MRTLPVLFEPADGAVDRAIFQRLAHAHRGSSKTALLAASLVALLGAAAAGAAEAPQQAEPEPAARTIGEALSAGKWGVGLRYRYESVDDDAFDEDGQASTLRTVLLYRSGSFHAFDLGLVFQNVSDLGLGDEHNNNGAGDAGNGVVDRPVIADPPRTDVYQAWVGYHGLPATDLVLGRQAIVLADERFVGPSGWRQNYQSFDSFRVDQRSIPRTRITYAYLVQANTPTGARAGMSTHLADVEVRPVESIRVTPYWYRVDYDDAASAGSSSDTLGARFEHDWKPGGAWSFPWLVEWATQRDAGDNPAEVDADYGRAIFTAKRARYWLRAAYEVLGGSVEDGRITTPLATLHKFNGWVDKFLQTPPDGLRDLSFGAGGRFGAFDAQIALREFRSDTAGLDYGRELDAQLRWTAPWKQVISLEAGRYDADEFSTDTTKVWLWTTYTFGPAKE